MRFFLPLLFVWVYLAGATARADESSLDTALQAELEKTRFPHLGGKKFYLTLGVPLVRVNNDRTGELELPAVAGFSMGYGWIEKLYLVELRADVLLSSNNRAPMEIGGVVSIVRLWGQQDVIPFAGAELGPSLVVPQPRAIEMGLHAGLAGGIVVFFTETGRNFDARLRLTTVVDGEELPSFVSLMVGFRY